MPSLNSSGFSRSARGLAAGDQLLDARASVSLSEHEYHEDYTGGTASLLISAGDPSYKPGQRGALGENDEKTNNLNSGNKTKAENIPEPFELSSGGATLDLDGTPFFPGQKNAVKFGECTTNGAVMNYITAAIGVGIFSLPGVYADVGIILGTILLVAAFFASMVMCKLIGSEMDLARKFKIREALANSIDTMDGVAKAALEGSKAQKFFVWFCLLVDNLDLLMTCTLFLSMSFPMLQKLMYQCKYGIMQGAYMILVSLVSDKVTKTPRNLKGIDWSDRNDATLMSKPWGTMGNDGVDYSKALCDDHLFESDKLKFARNLDGYQVCARRWETNPSAHYPDPRWVVDVQYQITGAPAEQVETAVLDVLSDGREVDNFKWISVAVTVLFLLATAFFKDMTALSKLSIVGVVGSAAAALFVTLAAISEICFNEGLGPDISWGFPSSASGEQSQSVAWLGAIAAGFSTIWFSYAVPVITPTVKSDMKTPSAFAKVAAYSHWVSASFDSSRTFSDADWNAKLKAICQVIVEIGILANVIVTYPIFLNPVAITIEGLLTKAFLDCGSSTSKASVAEEKVQLLQEENNSANNVHVDPTTFTTSSSIKPLDGGQQYSEGNDPSDETADEVDEEDNEPKELSPCKDLLLRLVVRSILIGVTVVLGTLLDLEKFMALIGAVTAMYTCVYLPFIIHCIFYARFWSKRPEEVRGFVLETELLAGGSSSSSHLTSEVSGGAASRKSSSGGVEDEDKVDAASDEKSVGEKRFVEQMRGIRIYNEYTWWKWTLYITTVFFAAVVSVLTILDTLEDEYYGFCEQL
eukprot:g15646.t1